MGIARHGPAFLRAVKETPQAADVTAPNNVQRDIGGAGVGSFPMHDSLEQFQFCFWMSHDLGCQCGFPTSQVAEIVQAGRSRIFPRRMEVSKFQQDCRRRCGSSRFTRHGERQIGELIEAHGIHGHRSDRILRPLAGGRHQGFIPKRYELEADDCRADILSSTSIDRFDRFRV